MLRVQPPWGTIDSLGSWGVRATQLESGSEHLTLRPQNLRAQELMFHMDGSTAYLPSIPTPLPQSLAPMGRARFPRGTSGPWLCYLPHDLDMSPSLGQHGPILPGEVWVCMTQTNTVP